MFETRRLQNDGAFVPAVSVAAVNLSFVNFVNFV